MKKIIAFVIVGHYRKLGDSRVVEKIIKFQNNHTEFIFHNHLFVSFNNASGVVFHKHISTNDLTFDEVKKKLNFKTINTFDYLNNRYARDIGDNYTMSDHKFSVNDEPEELNKENLVWSVFEDQKAKICNVSFPQFICMNYAYKFVKNYENTIEDKYDYFIRTRTDLVINRFKFDINNVQKNDVIVPEFVPNIHGISDHFAILGSDAADVYFKAYESFKFPNQLECRDKCFGVLLYKKNANKNIPNSLYDNVHNILNDHLLTFGCNVILTKDKVTATPSQHEFFVLR